MGSTHRFHTFWTNSQVISMVAHRYPRLVKDSSGISPTTTESDPSMRKTTRTRVTSGSSSDMQTGRVSIDKDTSWGNPNSSCTSDRTISLGTRAGALMVRGLTLRWVNIPRIWDPTRQADGMFVGPSSTQTKSWIKQMLQECSSERQ